MKLFSIVASRSKALLFRKSFSKRVISSFIATLAMSVMTLLFTSYNTKRIAHRVTAGEAQAAAFESVEAAPRGLSRQRKDFDKALTILADGANSNPKLNEYFERVTKRVRGEAMLPENGSGIRVARVSLSGRTSSDAQISRLSAPAELKDYQPSAMVADVEPLPEAPPSARVAMPDVDADGPAIASSGLTVGDMGFDLNPAIQHWVNYYTATTGGRRTMTIGLSRSQQYIEMARDEFRRAGVPEDLIWLAMVESVWNPTAVSPAAAGGLWQFIPKTAVEYGLTVERGNDERTDPVKQTRVAAEYLRDLYTLFGDWALAMAAYNSGEPRVMEAVVKNGRANFWELYEKQLLPKETRDYVPKILAAIKVVSEADTYGFSMDSLAVSIGQ